MDARVAVVLLAYPIWFALAGPGHISGPIQLVPQGYRADLLGAVVPDSIQRFAPTHLARIAANFSNSPSENGSYLGITLLAVLLVGTVALWRRTAVVRVASVLALFAFVLSLGAGLVVTGRPGAIATGFPLPERILTKLPVLANTIPARYALFVELFAALLLGVILDRLHRRLLTGSSGAHRHHRRAEGNRFLRAALLPGVVAVVALVPLWPAAPFTAVGPVGTPPLLHLRGDRPDPLGKRRGASTPTRPPRRPTRRHGRRSRPSISGCPAVTSSCPAPISGSPSRRRSATAATPWSRRCSTACSSGTRRLWSRAAGVAPRPVQGVARRQRRGGARTRRGSEGRDRLSDLAVRSPAAIRRGRNLCLVRPSEPGRDASADWRGEDPSGLVFGPVKRPYRVVVAKPGLDGHDRGAKVIARALRDAGFEVIYTGLHQTAEQVVQAVVQEDADAVGLSLLSGAHLTLVPRVVKGLAEQGRGDVLVLVGGIIPEADIPVLKDLGVAEVFTPGAPLPAIGEWLADALDERESGVA